MSQPKEKPSSREAIACGCTCDPLANNNRRGFKRAGVGVVFHPDLDFPLHGLKVAVGAVKSGEAVRLLDEDDH